LPADGFAQGFIPLLKITSGMGEGKGKTDRTHDGPHVHAATWKRYRCE
jgi:hypothetical protein